MNIFQKNKKRKETTRKPINLKDANGEYYISTEFLKQLFSKDEIKDTAYFIETQNPMMQQIKILEAILNVSGDRNRQETVAEMCALLSSPTTEKSLAMRSQFLMDNFPRTMAQVSEYLKQEELKAGQTF